MKIINYDQPESDKELIHKISKRAAKDIKADATSTMMDLLVVHDEIGLDLEKLLNADTFNLSHDIFGIARHLNRQTFELEDCFLPRCAKPKKN